MSYTKVMPILQMGQLKATKVKQHAQRYIFSSPIFLPLSLNSHKELMFLSYVFLHLPCK